jgi:hypothetical protein
MAWSDKIDKFSIKEDEPLVVSIDLESREYNGRWYTDVKAWKVTRAGAVANDMPLSAPGEYSSTQPEIASILGDEIPF